MNFTEEHFDRLCLIVGQILEGPDVYRDNLDFLEQDDIDFLEEIAIYTEELESANDFTEDWELLLPISGAQNEGDTSESDISLLEEIEEVL